MRRTFRSNTAIPTGTVCSKVARRRRSIAAGVDVVRVGNTDGKLRYRSRQPAVPVPVAVTVSVSVLLSLSPWLCVSLCLWLWPCLRLTTDTDRDSRHCDCQSSVTESYSSLWLPRLSWDCVCLNRNRLRLRRDFPRLPVNTSRYCVISLRAVLRCAVENLAMSFKLHIFTHDQDIVQIPSKVNIIVYNMYLEASEMCV